MKKIEAGAFLSKEGGFPEGFLFMPRSQGYGAKLNRYLPEDVRNNAGLLLKCLQKEADLLRPDLLVFNYDLTYLAEMSGCQVQIKEPFAREVSGGILDGREEEWAGFSIPALGESGQLKTYREVLGTVKKTTETPVASLVPTPFTLARQLAGDSFLRKFNEGDGQWEELMDAALFVVSDTVKLFLEGGSDGILFFEDLTGLETTLETQAPALLSNYYRTLYNILGYYQKRAIFCVSGRQSGAAAGYRNQAIAGICFSDLNPGEIEMPGVDQRLPVQGSGLRKDCWNTCEEPEFVKIIARHLELVDNSAPFIFSPLIPADAVPERVLTLVNMIASR